MRECFGKSLTDGFQKTYKPPLPFRGDGREVKK